MTSSMRDADSPVSPELGAINVDGHIGEDLNTDEERQPKRSRKEDDVEEEGSVGSEGFPAMGSNAGGERGEAREARGEEADGEEARPPHIQKVA